MNSFEKPDESNTPVGGEHLGKDYYEKYNSLFDLEMMASRIQNIPLPKEIDTNLKEQESDTFLVLGSATTNNINTITKIAHYLHGKEATLKDLVTIVDINDISIALHEKAIQELDTVSDWSKTSARERSVESFPYPEFKINKGDIRSLSEETASVDVAISDYTINYLDSKEDVSSFFNEVSRVLKEKGILYITLRYSKEGQSHMIINQGGVDISTFSLDEYKNLAEKAGLQIVATELDVGVGDTLIIFGKRPEKTVNNL